MSQKSPRKRQGPIEHAKDFKLGAIKKDIDGHQWIIKIIKKKDGTTYKRWVRLNNETKPITIIKQNTPKPITIKKIKPSPKPKRVKSPKFIPANSRVKISFTVNFVYFKYDFVESGVSPYPADLPEPVLKEVIQYINSKEFKENFELRIEGKNDKTIINKINWLIDELLVVDLDCTIHSNKKINIDEYKMGVNDTLYKISWAGSPTVSKYGKYLGEYKGRYGMYIDNNIHITLKI
jgi:hypothetical protein